MSEEKKTSLESIDHLLKDIYLEKITQQLNWQPKVFGEFKGFAPYKPTFKEKWKTFWNHILDFYHYLTQYKYETWRYWDKDGY